jgi:hypothetical protein
MDVKLTRINNLAASDSVIRLPFRQACASSESPIPHALHTRFCNVCGDPFTEPDRRIKHCSPKCADESKRHHRNARQSAYRVAHPERERAKLTLNNAIRGGHVRRCTRCEECGERGFIEAHHTDYSRPFYVTWLCKSCHAALDGGRHFGAGQIKHDGSVRDLSR